MEYLSLASVLFLVLLISWFLLRRKSKKSHLNLPPGPKGVPIFGYFPFLFPRRYEKYTELSKRYGDVMMVPLFTTNVLILGSFEVLQEAFVNQGDAFSARPQFRFADTFIEGCGILFTDGDKWRQHRRFALRTLRDFGFGKTISLSAVHQEVNALVARIEQEGDKGMDTMSLFSKMTANVICSLMFGDRVASEDKEFPRVKQMLNELVACDSEMFENVPLFFPWLMDVPLFMRIFGKYSKRKRLFRSLISYIQQKVIERTLSIQSVTEPRDFTDAILMHKFSLEAQGDSTHSFDTRSIAGDVLDLFAAGTDTTAVTLAWACLLLAQHPHVQLHVRKEVLEVIGSERLVSMQDRQRLNFTLAVLDEIARFASIAPTALTHRTEKAVTLKGYSIPADTIVVANIYGVHMDPAIWDNPSAFDPSHFLDEKGIYKPSPMLMPFSLGKRACLGESLARMELFVFFVSIIQRYDVTLDKTPGTDLKELMKGTNGLVRHLDQHRVIFKRFE